MKTEKIFTYDKAFLPLSLAGMDEAGRGPLAGPVVAACVMLPLDVRIDGIFDSKQVSEKKRERLYDEIVRAALAFGVGTADQNEIDEINILNATKKAMRAAYAAMHRTPDILLVDAVKDLGLPCECKAIVKGDATSYHIAAASIIAKVTRDRYMREMDALYPAYGFGKNKGYGTGEHIAALQAVGSCPLHRKSFIKNFVGASMTETEGKAHE